MDRIDPSRETVGEPTRTEVSSIDPVCGMLVPDGIAVASYEYAGTCYFFCSRECLERFASRPEAYMSSQQGAAQDGARGREVDDQTRDVYQGGYERR